MPSSARWEKARPAGGCVPKGRPRSRAPFGDPAWLGASGEGLRAHAGVALRADGGIRAPIVWMPLSWRWAQCRPVTPMCLRSSPLGAAPPIEAQQSPIPVVQSRGGAGTILCVRFARKLRMAIRAQRVCGVAAGIFAGRITGHPARRKGTPVWPTAGEDQPRARRQDAARSGRQDARRYTPGLAQNTCPALRRPVGAA